MKIDGRFPVQVLCVLVLLFALAAYPLMRYGSSDVVVASIVGALLATGNVLVGYLAIEYSIAKSYSTFLKAVLGGMGVRMLVMLIALIVFIKVFDLHATALTVSLLGCYAVFLLMEVMFVQRKAMSRNQN